MVVDPSTGGRINSAVLDTSGDGKLTAVDKVSSGGTDVYVSGLQSSVGITPTPAIVLGSSSGTVASPGSEIYGTSGTLLDDRDCSSRMQLAEARAAGPRPFWALPHRADASLGVKCSRDKGTI